MTTNKILIPTNIIFIKLITSFIESISPMTNIIIQLFGQSRRSWKKPKCNQIENQLFQDFNNKLTVVKVLRRMNYHQKTSFKQTLDDIVQHQNCPLKINQSSSKTQITEKVKWLQNKVQQQSVQIQTLSSQLSKEMRMKDHIQCLLYQQKQKTSRIDNSLNGTSRQHNSSKQDSNRKKIVDDDSITGKEKTIHMVDKIRNKDILGNKHKLKMDQNTVQSNNCLQIEKEVCSLRQLFIDSQHKQSSLLHQIQSLKMQLWEKQQSLFQSHKKCSKIKMEYQVVLKELCNQQQEIKIIHEDTKELMKRQNQQIEKLQHELSLYNPKNYIKQKQLLGIAKRQMRKALVTHLHDDCLRKKIQIQMIMVLEGLSGNGNYLRHTSTNE